jgi:ribonuclease G
LTAEISLAGRNIVLLPFAQKVSVSQKISSKEEKKRLETLVKSILPANYGAIIRTAAEDKTASVLVAELRSLINKWEGSWAKLKISKGINLLFTETDKTTAVLRDLFNDSFSNVYVNDKRYYEDIRQYISLISPEHEKIAKLYEGKEPIFDHFEVTRQIKSSFGKIVPMRQGAYLVIESTEALNVIDVNSGTRSKTNNQEDNVFEVNKIAAEEIARQLRLRDMGGIIIVDFIDMDNVEHRNELFKFMKELMDQDRAKHSLLPLTKFGLMQITRQRIRPVTEINTTEKCPLCHGTGKIASTVVIDEEIERTIADLVEKGHKQFTIRVSPILGAYLSRGFNSYICKWKRKYKCKVRLIEMTEHSILQYEIIDEKGRVL